MSQAPVIDVVESFKENYPEWGEISGDGFCDGANVVAIYPEESGNMIGIDMTMFDVHEFEWELGTFIKSDGSSTNDEIYRAKTENEVSYFSKSIVDPFLETIDAKSGDLLMRDVGHDHFPIKVQIPNSEWDGVIAPRISSDAGWRKIE